MKKITLFLLIAGSLHASYNTARVFNNFLVKITNNSSKTFRLYCSNKDWNLVLFSSTSQLDLFAEKFDKPLSKLQQEYDDLFTQKNARVSTLRSIPMSEEQIAKDPQIQDLDKKIQEATEKLRPVIKPKSVNDNLPCRIFGPGDTPTDKPAGWQWPETEIKGDSIGITLLDTYERGNCPTGRIKITAKSATYETSLCTDDTLYFGQIHLIIEENGTFKLEQLPNPIPK